MKDVMKAQEREELHRTIWAIANDLRGAVDGWDFKQYVLGMLFYRYISENLTNCIAVDCIDYLLHKPHPSKKEKAACVEMARFAEDQFTRWHSPLDEDARGDAGDAFSTPFVYEQYSFQCPIDASTVGVANALMNIYEATGDVLSLAKAKALVDSIVKLQDPETGCIPTSLNMGTDVDITEHWVNCTFSSIEKLMRLDRILNSK